MIAVKWDCDRSRDVAMATNFCLFKPHIVFRQAISPKRNEIGIIVAFEVEQEVVRDLSNGTIFDDLG